MPLSHFHVSVAVYVRVIMLLTYFTFWDINVFLLYQNFHIIMYLFTAGIYQRQLRLPDDNKWTNISN